MGNKQSHNFSKSKSASLSNIPYKWDNISYNSKKRPASIASNSPKETPKSILRNNNNKLSNTKRTSSLGSLSDTSSGKRKSAPAPKPSKQNAPPQPVQPKRPASVAQQAPTLAAQRQTSTTSLRQYNDAHLQSDIKKLFKAHDKSNAKAMIEDETEAEVMTAESLDRRLETLKRQRNKDVVDAKQPEWASVTANVTLPRKSRKDRKAPSLPPSTPSAPVISSSQPTSNGIKPRPTTAYKKKAAPAPPPSRSVSMSLESSTENPLPPDGILDPESALPDKPPEEPTLPTSSNVEIIQDMDPVKPTPQEDSNNNNNSNVDIPAAVTEESIVESTTAHKIESAASSIMAEAEIKPHTDKSPETVAVTVKPEHADIKQPQCEDHPLSAIAETSSAKQTVTVIERELRSTTTLSRKQKKAPHAPPATPISAEVIAKLSSDFELEAITNKAVDDNKEAEQKEIAIQYDAPVDMAIQCDGTTLKEQKQKENKEKLGSILKLFIDKNAEEDAKRNPDDKSPDSEEIIGVEEKFEQAIQEQAATESKVVENMPSSDEMQPALVVEAPASKTPDAKASPELEIPANGSMMNSHSDNQNNSPTNSNDSGHDEPSVLSSSINTGGSGGHSPVSQPTISPFLSPTPVPFPSASDLNDNHGANSPKTKKHKNRYSGIHRITKTMRSFMSSIGRSASKTPSPKDEIESKDDDDGAMFSGDNWVLSKGDRPAVVRKEYHPSLNAETFQPPENNASQNENSQVNNEVNETISLSSKEEEDDDKPATAEQTAADLQVDGEVTVPELVHTETEMASKLEVADTKEEGITDPKDLSTDQNEIVTPKEPEPPAPETIIIDKAEITFDPSKVAVETTIAVKSYQTADQENEDDIKSNSSQTVIAEENLQNQQDVSKEDTLATPPEYQKHLEDSEVSNKVTVSDVCTVTQGGDDNIQVQVTPNDSKMIGSISEQQDEKRGAQDGKAEESEAKGWVSVDKGTEDVNAVSDGKSNGAVQVNETMKEEQLPAEGAVVMRKHKQPQVGTAAADRLTESSCPSSELQKSPSRTR